ncbi:protein S100-A11-like [Nematolebias whitei]|uniref:protein S100-A11-like n=1 Tax=Nematolebias whitei TaxID=451745 RepID=UPI00189A7875|nr:protein S100-A11-like [Nematolebias whitei]
MKRSKDITPLELSVGSLLCVFMEYQNADGTLSKETFCKCLAEQMPSFDLAKAGEELFKTVDINEDGKLEFKEFAVLVCSFACSNYDALQEVMKTCKDDGNGK